MKRTTKTTKSKPEKHPIDLPALALSMLTQKVDEKARKEASERMEIVREQIAALRHAHGLTLQDFIQATMDSDMQHSPVDPTVIQAPIADPPRIMIARQMAEIIDRMMAKTVPNPFHKESDK